MNFGASSGTFSPRLDGVSFGHSNAALALTQLQDLGIIDWQAIVSVTSLASCLWSLALLPWFSPQLLLSCYTFFFLVSFGVSNGAFALTQLRGLPGAQKELECFARRQAGSTDAWEVLAAQGRLCRRAGGARNPVPPRGEVRLRLWRKSCPLFENHLIRM
jgi:hypothetical protein